MLPETKPAHGRYGVALVEIALVLPVFLAVVGGLTALGRAASVMQSLHDAARLGSRLAAEPGATNAAVMSAVRASLQETAGLPAEKIDCRISIEPAPGNADPADDVALAHPKDQIRVVVQVPSGQVAWLTETVLQKAALSAESQIRR